MSDTPTVLFHLTGVYLIEPTCPSSHMSLLYLGKPVNFKEKNMGLQRRLSR